MKRIETPWFRDFFSIPNPPKLSRAEFVAKYMPKYASDYKPPVGIRAYVNKSGRYCVPQTTNGSIQSQLTKRQNRIDEAYQLYCSHWDAQNEMDSKNSKP